MNIFVGNLSFEAGNDDLYGLFMPFGSVTKISIVMEKKGDKSRGFGFLEMPDEQQALAAIAALHGKEFMGRPLNVEQARPKPEAGKGERKRQKRVVKKADTAREPAQPFERTGEYRKGRRTLTFLKKRAEAGITKPYIPKRKNKENPLRWKRKAKPWEKKKEKSKETRGAPRTFKGRPQ